MIKVMYRLYYKIIQFFIPDESRDTRSTHDELQN